MFYLEGDLLLELHRLLQRSSRSVANEVSRSDIDIVAMKMANLLRTTMFAVSLKFEQSKSEKSIEGCQLYHRPGYPNISFIRAWGALLFLD